MIEILEGLYLGNREDARDLGRLEAEGVTHIVNCAAEIPNYHEGTLTYLALKLYDPDPTFHTRIATACEFIDDARRDGKVLVHCFAAISRSPATVLTYLCHLGDSLESAAQKLSAKVWTDPDSLFIRQLAEHLGEKIAGEDLERLSRLLQGREQR